jgi:hypothetical protein
MRRWLDRLGVAVVYTVALGVGTTVLHAQPRARRDAWLDWASTNLANAPHHPIGSMVVSALFTEGDVRGWLVLSLVGLGSVGWRFGAWRTAVLVAAAHVIGTVVSEGILGIRIAIGSVPHSELHTRDVGPSYVVAAALVAGIAYGPWLAKLPCVLGFLSIVSSLFGGLFQLVVSSVGHTTAIAVALALGGLFEWRRRRRPAGTTVRPSSQV